jgi:Cft2 family RNA processing exonuclease
VKLTFLGGADEVGGTCKLVEMAGHRFVVDCGIRLGSGRSDPLPLLSLIEEAGGAEAIFITHGHADHIGAVPVFHQSYPVPVFTIDPTAQLMRIMFGDALNIMEMNTERDGRVPLYTELMAQRALDSLQLVPVKTTFQLWDGDIEVTFYPSGHIIGACSILFESAEESLFMTGDISVADQLTVEGMKIAPIQPDVVVIESTYGGKKHLNRTLEEERVTAQVSEVLDMKGRILFPAFAVGRAQEIILLLVRAMEEGRLQRAPIYVDGMVRQVCAIYRYLPDFTSEWLRRRIKMKGDPFFCRDSPAMPVVTQRRKHYAMQEQAIFVSSSGMLTGGWSPVYAKRLANDPRSMIAITGYQDEESPGRRLQDVARQQGGSLKLGDEWVNLRCKVSTYSLSAHADESQLIGIASALQPHEIVLEHGDDKARSALKQSLNSATTSRVHLPVLGQQLEFGPRAKRLPRARSGQNLRVAVRSAVDSGASKNNVDVAVRRSVVPEIVTSKKEMDVTTAIETVRKLFPPEARLCKVGAPGRSLVLYFGIPRKAWHKYQAIMQEIPQLTGWTVQVAETPQGKVLIEEVEKILPEQWKLLKPIGVHAGKEKQVLASVDEPEPNIELIADAAREFEYWTGFQLVIKGTETQSALPKSSVIAPPAGVVSKSSQVMARPVQPSAAKANVSTTKQVGGTKINSSAAIQRLKAAFENSEHAPVKVVLWGKELEVGFITPQVAELYTAKITALETVLGLAIKVRSTCEHNRVREIVTGLVPAAWGLKTNFRVNVNDAVVTVVISKRPSPDEIRQVCAAFNRMTRFTLTIKLQ